MNESKDEIKKDAANRSSRTLFQNLAAVSLVAAGIYATEMAESGFEADWTHAVVLMAMMFLSTGAAYLHRRYGK